MGYIAEERRSQIVIAEHCSRRRGSFAVHEISLIGERKKREEEIQPKQRHASLLVDEARGLGLGIHDIPHHNLWTESGERHLEIEGDVGEWRALSGWS